MIVERNLYLNRLIERKDNGMIKVITGIRRCGKSFLLFKLYYEWLLKSGVDDRHIVKVALDDEVNEAYADKAKLGEYIRKSIVDDRMHYVFLDEIQFVDGFERLLNGLNKIENLDVYVTGSNSKFLSSDILTEFRGRGDEVRVCPLSFSEFFTAAVGKTKDEAFAEYCLYGGLPQILNQHTPEQKSSFLCNVFKKVYLDDVVGRNNLRGNEPMGRLVEALASSVGSYTNSKKIADTFAGSGRKGISEKTITTYIDCLLDSFLISKASRYDVKGKKYISALYKYYFCDCGIRNAILNFRQYEETRLMENVIYGELLARGYSVDVGVVTHDEKTAGGKITRKQLEVDFVVNRGFRRYYIQSVFAIPDMEKTKQEQKSLVNIPDSFRKIIIVGNSSPSWQNEQGIVMMNIYDFLLNPNSLEGVG